MKKLCILALLFAALLICSCDDLVKNDITVKNNCGYPILAAVTQSQTHPESSAYVLINDGNSGSFTGLENGAYFPHLSKQDSDEVFTSEESIHVELSQTWTITPADSKGFNIKVSW